MTTALNIKSKDFIIKGLTALKGACEGDQFDADSLDLSECDKQERNALMTFLAKNKKITSFAKLKEAFKSYCLGTVTIKAEPTKEKVLPKDHKVAKVVTKEQPKTTKKAPKEEKVAKVEKVKTAGPARTENMTGDAMTYDGKVFKLFGVDALTVKVDLEKRNERYLATFRWCLWKRAQQTDICYIPHSIITKKEDLNHWLLQCAKQLVICYCAVSANGEQSHPHPADSQGILNDEDRAV
jgi:hypothetical protein